MKDKFIVYANGKHLTNFDKNTVQIIQTVWLTKLLEIYHLIRQMTSSLSLEFSKEKAC